MRKLADIELGGILNPLKGTGYLSKIEQEKRNSLATPERMAELRNVIAAVREFQEARALRELPLEDRRQLEALILEDFERPGAADP